MHERGGQGAVSISTPSNLALTRFPCPLTLDVRSFSRRLVLRPHCRQIVHPRVTFSIFLTRAGGQLWGCLERGGVGRGGGNSEGGSPKYLADFQSSDLSENRCHRRFSMRQSWTCGPPIAPIRVRGRIRPDLGATAPARTSARPSPTPSHRLRVDHLQSWPHRVPRHALLKFASDTPWQVETSKPVQAWPNLRRALGDLGVSSRARVWALARRVPAVCCAFVALDGAAVHRRAR